MEDQIIDVSAQEVQESPPDVSPAEAKRHLKELKELNKQLKKIKRYMKSPLHEIRKMDSRSSQ